MGREMSYNILRLNGYSGGREKEDKENRPRCHEGGSELDPGKISDGKK